MCVCQTYHHAIDYTKSIQRPCFMARVTIVHLATQHLIDPMHVHQAYCRTFGYIISKSKRNYVFWLHLLSCMLTTQQIEQQICDKSRLLTTFTMILEII